MRLSEIRKVLKQAEELAKQLGNDDPEITFWHDDLEPDMHFNIVVNPYLSECLLLNTKNQGNFSFRLEEKETPDIK